MTFSSLRKVSFLPLLQANNSLDYFEPTQNKIQLPRLRKRVRLGRVIFHVPLKFWSLLLLSDHLLLRQLFPLEYLLHFQRSEEHTSELQSRFDIVCRLLLEKKNL